MHGVSTKGPLTLTVASVGLAVTQALIARCSAHAGVYSAKV